MTCQNQINVLTVFFYEQSNLHVMNTFLSANQIFVFRILPEVSDLVLSKRIAASGNEIVMIAPSRP